MNIANKLTLLRIILIPVFLVFLLMGITPYSKEIALGIFIVASITDALDGHLARSLNLITNFGKFLDPVADKLLVCSALIAFVQLNMLPAWVVIVIISRDFILMTFRMIASSSNIVIAADKIGKIKTIFQMVMIIYLLVGLEGAYTHLIDTTFIWAVVVLTVASALNYIIKNIAVLDLNNI